MFLLCCTPQTFAASVVVGDLEYNTLFSGVDDFTIDNFTGSNNLGFFPVADNVSFDDSVLTLTELGGGTLVFDLATLDRVPIPRRSSPQRCHLPKPLSRLRSIPAVSRSRMAIPGRFLPTLRSLSHCCLLPETLWWPALTSAQ
jgi:hypothetical protein